MANAKEISDIISQATGTTQYYKFSQIPQFPVITDGVKSVVELAGCYWLLDVIGFKQIDPKLDKAFQVWKLEVDTENTRGVLRGFNDTTLIITQDVPFTTFPLAELKLFLIDGVLLLPSEY